MNVGYQPAGIPGTWVCTVCWSLVLARDTGRHEAFHTEWQTWMASIQENFDAVNESFEGAEKALKHLDRRIVEGR